MMFQQNGGKVKTEEVMKILSQKSRKVDDVVFSAKSAGNDGITVDITSTSSSSLVQGSVKSQLARLFFLSFIFLPFVLIEAFFLQLLLLQLLEQALHFCCCYCDVKCGLRRSRRERVRKRKRTQPQKKRELAASTQLQFQLQPLCRQKQKKGRKSE